MRPRDAVSARIVWPMAQVAHAVVSGERRTLGWYRRGLAFREAARGWSDARREDWQLGALRHAVRGAFDTTPFYRRLWREAGFDPRHDFGYDDFARLPVVTRADLQDAGADVLSAAVSPRDRRRDATGGSTGRPLVIWTGPEERGWRASGSETFFRRLGVPTGTRTALLWGHHLDPVARGSLAARLVDAAANREWLEAFRLSPERLLDYHHRLQAARPACIVAYASALADLAAVVAEAGGGAPGYPRRCFVTGGEKLHASQRELVERVFNKPVHERYGSRDVGNMAFQYRRSADALLEVDWALVHLEPATGDAVAPIVATKLHGDAMPLIRYAVDDVAEFPPGSRPGHPALTLRAVLGRAVDRIVLPGGAWVHGHEFPHLLKDFPLRDYQVAQGRDLGVEVRLVPRREFTPDHRTAIERTLRANLPGLALRVVEVEAIARTAANKWRPVVSEA